MIGLKIVLEEDQDKDRFSGKKLIHIGNDAPAMELIALKEGMASGKTSLSMIFHLDGETVVVAETSLSLLISAVDALKARFPE